MALIGDESPPSKPSKPVSQWIGSARWRFVRKVLVIAPALCVTILLLLSLLPQMPGLRGLDDSYLVCINFAIMHRIRLGIDFFSTYGPWGFLYDGFYYPGLYGKKLACDFLLAIALFMGIYRICRNARMSPVAASWWVVLVVLWLTPAFGDARIISMCLLPLLLRRTNNQKQDSMESFLLVFVLALAGNCKFTYLNIGIAVIGLLAVEDILSKRVPKMLLLYVGSFLFWRALSGQTIADFPAYYAGSSAIAKGYMGAMSLDGDHAVTTGVVWLFSILVSLQMLHCFWHTSIVSRFITVASFAGVFFYFEQAGFRPKRWGA